MVASTGRALGVGDLEGVVDDALIREGEAHHHRAAALAGGAEGVGGVEVDGERGEPQQPLLALLEIEGDRHVGAVEDHRLGDGGWREGGGHVARGIDDRRDGGWVDVGALLEGRIARRIDRRIDGGIDASLGWRFGGRGVGLGRRRLGCDLAKHLRRRRRLHEARPPEETDLVLQRRRGLPASNRHRGAEHHPGDGAAEPNEPNRE